MAFTLYDQVYQTMVVLGVLRRGTVTTGSTTGLSFSDTSRVESDEFFKDYDSCVFMVRTADGAAPQGEYERISEYDQDGNPQVTLAAALSAAIDVGDMYRISLPKYPVDLVESAVNAVYGRYEMPLYDDSLSTVSGQTEYDLPSTIPLWGICGVDIETDKDDSNDQGFVPLHNCRVDATSTGGTHKLVIPRELTPGYTLRILYNGPHPLLEQDDDSINRNVPIEKMAYEIAIEAIRMKMENYPSGDKTVGGRLTMMLEQSRKNNVRAYFQATMHTKRGDMIIPRIGK